MYRFCYAAAVPAQPHVYDPSSTIMHSTTDSLINQLIPLDPSDYGDLNTYSQSKQPHYFDMTAYHDATYGPSTASESAGSVYHSPIDGHKQMPFVLSSDDHLLSPPASYHQNGGVNNYVSRLIPCSLAVDTLLTHCSRRLCDV